MAEHETATDATRKPYQVVNGTSYHASTPEDVIRVLENARASGRRIHIHYGDTETGRDWNKENDVTGTVDRSSGSVKVPILLANARSLGGGAILDHCIVKITTTTAPRQTLYQHPLYQERTITIQPGEMDEYPSEVLINGEVQARFRTEAAALRYVSKMT